jgi:hypothetical protein
MFPLNSLFGHKIQELRNVGVQDPVHTPAHDANRERVQRIVLTAPRPEPVREPEEILLVDRVEQLDERPLSSNAAIASGLGFQHSCFAQALIEPFAECGIDGIVCVG